MNNEGIPCGDDLIRRAATPTLFTIHYSLFILLPVRPQARRIFSPAPLKPGTSGNTFQRGPVFRPHRRGKGAIMKQISPGMEPGGVGTRGHDSEKQREIHSEGGAGH